MMFVQRNDSGAIVGAYANQQDFATEEMADDAEELVAFLHPVVIPNSVSQRQARLALLQLGRLDAVNAALAALPDDQKQAAQIQWEFASAIVRDNQLVQMLAQALSLDLDELFTLAATL